MYQFSERRGAYEPEQEGKIALSGVAGQSCSQNPWTVSILEEKIELHPIREAGLAIADSAHYTSEPGRSPIQHSQ
jgi:hypothetical protein